MKKKLSLSAFVLLVVPCLLVAANLETYKQKYASGITGINAEYDSDLSALRKAYSEGLSAIKEKAQAAGELDALKAILAELERFQTEGRLPADSGSITPSLRSLCQRCQQLMQHAAKSRAQKTATLNTQYASALERLQRDLTREGELKEATAVQAERKRLADSLAAQTQTYRRADQPVAREPVATRSSLVPIDIAEWRSVIWNKRASRWQKQALQNLSTRLSQDELWVKNTSRVHRAAKIALRDSLSGDFTVTTEIKGRFGIELMHPSGESGRGYGVYGFPTDEWLRLVVTRKGGELSIQCSDGQNREFKGKQGNSRVSLDFCISLSQGSEIEIRHFQHGRGLALALAEEKRSSRSPTVEPTHNQTPRTTRTSQSPGSGPMSDSLQRSLGYRRESLEKALANDEGYMALDSFVDYTKTEMKRKRPPPGSARSIPTGIDEYERQMQALIAQAEAEIAKWKQLESFLGTHGYKFGERGRWPQQKLTDLSEARLNEIKTALSQEQARQAGARKTCLVNLVHKIDSQLKDNKADSQYTARVEAMYKKYHAERGTTVGLDKVAFEPEKYRGKVLRSTVQIHHWNGLFAPLASTAVQQFRCTDSLEKKCWKAYQAKGEYGVMKIKYVVGDDDDLYLLDITL